jgi:hypothetical protein
MNKIKTSGNRTGWITAVADVIMDGGAMPPSVVLDKAPRLVTTAQNDGHVTAGQVLGEAQRDDYQAGWKIIVEEMTDILVSQGFVARRDDGMLAWNNPKDGIWYVEVGESKVKLRGQRERRLDRDREFLGESDEKTGEASGTSLVERDKAKAIEVEVIGPRGASEFMAFRVHPYALAIPPMTEREREALREDILKNGVQFPLKVFPDADEPDEKERKRLKVLDGRHRLYLASTSKVPVRIEEFKGTEEEARAFVNSANLVRRNLTAPQRAKAIVKLFAEPAKKKAAETRLETEGRPGKTEDKLGSISSPVSEQKKAAKNDRRWSGIAVSMAGGAEKTGVTSYAVESIAKVLELDAPVTQAKVDSGEITQITRAVKQAETEHAERKGLAPPVFTPGKTYDGDRTIFTRLGVARKEMLAILADLDVEMGGKAPNDVFDRIGELEELLRKIRQTLFKRGTKCQLNDG